MLYTKNVSGLTGADEVDILILLGMLKTTAAFERTATGAGLQGKCLAYLAPIPKNVAKEGDYLGQFDQSKAV